MQVLVYTTDQQGETIASLVSGVKEFAAANYAPKLEFKLATGNVGVMAATNEAVDSARWEMNFAIFGALLLMCLVTFRSLRATLCILIPLALVSVLCEALMPLLGIGLKVSTLPVIALGVGVGFDYGIYLYDRNGVHQEAGQSPRRQGVVEVDRQVRDRVLLFESVQVIHQQLCSPDRKRGHQGDAMAQRGAGDDLGQLLLRRLFRVPTVTVGRLYEQVIGLFDGFRGEHQRIVRPPQVPGTHQIGRAHV